MYSDCWVGHDLRMVGKLRLWTYLAPPVQGTSHECCLEPAASSPIPCDRSLQTTSYRQHEDMHECTHTYTCTHTRTHKHTHILNLDVLPLCLLK